MSSVRYISRQLSWHDKDGKKHSVSDDDLVGIDQPLIILGPPGIGKTTLMERLGKANGARFVRATSFLREDDKPIQGTTRIVIDGLDEVAAVKEGDPLQNVLEKLNRRGQPRFILSCRSLEWRGVTAKNDILEDYGATPLELMLEPFTRDDAVEVLSKDHDVKNVEAAIRGLDEANLWDIYANPLTLGFVSAILNAGGEMPGSRAALYEHAVKQLRLERNERLKQTDLARLPEDAALDAAGAAMAVLLITGKSALRNAASNDVEEVVPITELADIADVNNISAALGSNLFKPDSSNPIHVVPLHRTIAEFLGARWLSKHVDKSDHKKPVIARLLGLISADGGVPASLRGLHAWLAHFSPVDLGPKVIEADPYGVLRYSDADSLSLQQARQVLTALKALSEDDPWFRSGDWREFSAKGLMQSALQGDIESLLNDKATSFHLRSLLLESIKGSALALLMKDELLRIVRDPDQTYHERSACIDALIALNNSNINWPEIVRELTVLADENSTRLATNMIMHVGFGSFDDELIADTAIGETGLNASSRAHRSRSVGELYILGRRIPETRIIGVLDALVGQLPAVRDPIDAARHANDDGKRELANLVVTLIARQIEHEPRAITSNQLLSWLLLDNRWYNHENDERKVISRHLEENEELRRDVQRLVMFEGGYGKSPFEGYFNLSRIIHGLRVQNEDATVFLKEMSDGIAVGDVDLWRRLVNQFRSDKGVPIEIQSIARPYAKDDTSLTEFLTSTKRRKLEDWEKQERRRLRQREKRQQAARETNRNIFLENIEALRAGEFRWIVNPGKAYLGWFSDLNRESPPIDRLAEWLGDDLRDAALDGFEAVLHRNDLPTVQQIAESYAQSMEWGVVYPMIAGAAERLAKDKDFSDLKSELISAIAIALEQSLIEQDHRVEGLLSSLKAELNKRDSAYEAYIRRMFEPHFREKSKHVTGLYTFLRSDDERALALRLSAEWLTTFADLSLDIEDELVRCLINGPAEAREENQSMLSAVVRNRLANNSLDEATKVFWRSVQFAIDFEQAITSTPPITEGNRALLWSHTDWFHDRYREGENKPVASVHQLKWIVEQFRSVWDVVPQPNSGWSGDKNPWDATGRIEWAIGKLATDASVDATQALADLRAMPNDGYTPMIQNAIARQRRVRLEAHFETPSLAELKAALANDKPKSATDVQVVIIDALDDLQSRLRGHPLNPVNNFYDDNGGPRTENKCRDQMLLALDTLPFGIQSPSEVAMPQGKRSDGAFTYGEFAIPLEVKGQWHDDVWEAAATQLDRFYTIDHKAASKGIYIVLWFGAQAPAGRKLKAPPENVARPQTPEEMRASLIALLPDYRRGDIAIFVLDVTRP